MCRRDPKPPTELSAVQQGGSSCFAFVHRIDRHARARIGSVLKSQGLVYHQTVTFVTDGRDTVRSWSPIATSSPTRGIGADTASNFVLDCRISTLVARDDASLSPRFVVVSGNDAELDK